MSADVFDVRVTAALEGGLNTTWMRNLSLDRVLDVIGDPVALHAYKCEVFRGDVVRVFLMRHGRLVHLSLWPSNGKCCYLCSSDPEAEQEFYSDLGWESYPDAIVVGSVEDAVEAVRVFLLSGQLEPGKLWHCEDVGPPFDW